MEFDSDLGDSFIAAGRELIERTDDDLMAMVGQVVTKWADTQDGGWDLTAIIATLIDGCAYMIAQYAVGDAAMKKQLLGTTAAGLIILGHDFIKVKTEEDAKKQAMN